MSTENFENLGFQIDIDGADSAVSNLDRIIARLEKIQRMQGTLSNIAQNNESSNRGEENEQLSKAEKYLKRVNEQKELLNSKTYEEARSIELSNKQRRKEIDQRIQQEKGIKKVGNSIQGFIKKLTTLYALAKRTGQFLISAINEASKYTENLNLFAVAFGETYEETIDWALDLADGFGLANNEVVKFAGTFRQLATSLGLVGETATSITKTVTELGYDLSALFNTSVENTMEVLQSSIFSGNVRPLRQYGIDVSQTSIQTLLDTNEALKKLNINASDLSQSDKVIARLIITLADGSNAFGTMSREINTLQSQFRIFQGQLSNFKLAIGDLLQEPVRKALVWVNGLLIAVTKLVRAFVPINKEDESTGLSSAFKELGEEADDANDSVEELSGNLASFDKFDVLNQSTSSSNDLEISKALTEELEKQQALYEEQLKIYDDIENQAMEAAKKILGWFVELDNTSNDLEIKKDADNLPIWTENAKNLGEAIKTIANALQLVGVMAAFAKSPFAGIASLFGIAAINSEEFRKQIKDAFIIEVKNADGTLEKINALSSLLQSLVNLITENGSKLGGFLLKIGDFITQSGAKVIDIFEKLLPVVERIIDAVSTFLNNVSTDELMDLITAFISAKLYADMGGNGLTQFLSQMGSSSALRWIKDLFQKTKTDDNTNKDDNDDNDDSNGGNNLSPPPAVDVLPDEKLVEVPEPSTALKDKWVLDDAGNLIKDVISNSGEIIKEEIKNKAENAAIVGGALAVGGAAVGLLSSAKSPFAGSGGGGGGAYGMSALKIASLDDLGFLIMGFADGGYTNANLIMTHENGKREWIGRAAGSNAIVNDTQMSDIMESSVAKGVYKALVARNDMSGNKSISEKIVIKIGNEAVFNAVRNTARENGMDFTNI